MSSLVERLTTQTAAPDELRGMLAGIRRRWRLRHMLAGTALLAAAAFVLLFAGAAVLRQFRFAPESVIATRWTVALLFALAAVWWIARPLVRRAGDARVALYAEEHEPVLDGSLIGAVDVAASSARGPLQPLAGHLIAHTVRQMRMLSLPHRIEQTSVRRHALALGGVVAAGLLIARLTPADLRHGAALLLAPWTDARAAAPYAVLVEPGDADVAKGSDVQIRAQLRGFAAAHVILAARRGRSTAWERHPMTPAGDSAVFEIRLFDLAASTEYYAEASGVRSGIYNLRVRELPAVQRIDLEYRYPAYTGLGVERVSDGGDVAALVGTRVTVRVRTTLPVRGGRLSIEGDSARPFTAATDTTLEAAFTVLRDGFYRIELHAADGTRVTGSVDYAIDALQDAPPTVAIRKPGRDTRPTSVEELFIEVTADDDYGVAALELVHRVNGGEEKVAPLTAPNATRREITASHTIYLEELGLQPGDVVSYYARARDNNALAAGHQGQREQREQREQRGQRAASDIYFATVRPFQRDYRQNQAAGGGGGGGEEDSPRGFAARQRQIIAGTYKVERDRATMAPRELRENVATLVLSQARLRERVERLVARMRQRNVAAADSVMRQVLELLPLAVKGMQGAEAELAARRTKEALGPEHSALQYLERAEAAFREVEVNFGGGGGGGGASDAEPEDLADLFELDADRLRNQYETVQQSQPSQAQRELDETLERLKQLASRQQAENERALQQPRGVPPNGGAGGGGGAQRQLADEAEQLARQLERLTREQQSPQLEESARRLREAANAMRRSAAGDGAQTRASAADELERARRLLEQARAAGVNSRAQDALERARRLATEQRGIADEVARGRPEPERERRLDDRKAEMASDVKQLEADIDRLAREGRATRPEASRRLTEAADGLRQGRVADKIQYSRTLARAGQQESRRGLEEQIAEDLEALAESLGNAVASAESDPNARASRALERARSLARGLSSLEDRMQQGEGAASSQGAGRPQEAPGAQPGREGGAGVGAQGEAGQRQGGQGQGQAGQQQGQAGQQQGQGGAARGNEGGRQENTGQGGGYAAFSPNEIRQFTRELRERRSEAEALRRDLAQSELETGGVEGLIRRLRELESGRPFNDPAEVARLQRAVVQGFQELEFALSRALGELAGEGPTHGGSSDVPAAYRELVDRYFKALAQKGRP